MNCFVLSVIVAVFLFMTGIEVACERDLNFWTTLSNGCCFAMSFRFCDLAVESWGKWRK